MTQVFAGTDSAQSAAGGIGDTQKPTFTATTAAGDNSTLTITLSETVYNATGGSGALETSDFTLSKSSGTATLTSSLPSSISGTYTLGITLTGSPGAGETITVVPSSSAAIYDAYGNAAVTSQSNNTAVLNTTVTAQSASGGIGDTQRPTFTAATVAGDNSTLTITLSETVYNATGGSGALETSDFTLSKSGGTATIASLPSSISGTCTLGMTLTGTPEGSEIITVAPSSSTAIYDAYGNAALADQSNNTALLNTTVTFANGNDYSPVVTVNNINQAFGRFALTGAGSGSHLTATTIKINETHNGASNFKLWASVDNAFGSDSQIGSTVATDPGAGNTVSFSEFSSSIGTSTRYYFISSDLASDATGLIRGLLVNNGALTISDGTLSGSIANDVLSGGDVSLPIELSSFTADNTRFSEITLEWVTESEFENLGFILERCHELGSSDSEVWLEIASYLTDDALLGQGSVTQQMEYTFTDKTVEPSETYDYRLADVSYAGEIVYHSLVLTDIEARSIPKSFALHSPYPNPFNPTTTIHFDIPNLSYVRITIYDIRGREVILIRDTMTEPGVYRQIWNGVKEDGCQVGTGIYFVRMVTTEFSAMRKVLFLK